MDRCYAAAGFHMIREIEVQNFKCYEYLKVQDCARLNIIVGANGVGKTALLESIFLPLAVGPEVAMRFRAQRGFDGTFGGSKSRIEKALWGDFFFNNDASRSITLTVAGDGDENRSLLISRIQSQISLPFGPEESATVVGPIMFQWGDANGVPHPAIPQISAAGMQLPETGEDMPNFFHFPASQMVGTSELAATFSDLISQGLDRQFIEVFGRE